MSERREYRPDGMTLRRYLMSTANVVCIQGPVRSGKSVASIMRIYKAMMEVEPDHTGKRRSRWLVIRNTYTDIEQSTLKTWLEWFAGVGLADVHPVLLEDAESGVVVGLAALVVAGRVAPEMDRGPVLCHPCREPAHDPHRDHDGVAQPHGKRPTGHRVRPARLSEADDRAGRGVRLSSEKGFGLSDL